MYTVPAVQSTAVQLWLPPSVPHGGYGTDGAVLNVLQKNLTLLTERCRCCRSRPAIVDTGVMVMDNASGVLRKTLRATKAANQHKPALWEIGREGPLSAALDSGRSYQPVKLKSHITGCKVTLQLWRPHGRLLRSRQSLQNHFLQTLCRTPCYGHFASIPVFMHRLQIFPRSRQLNMLG